MMHEDWRHIAKKAWSFRFMAIAAILSGVEVALTLFTNDPPIDRMTFAIISGVVSVAAMGSRLFAQKGFVNNKEDDE